MDNKNIEQLVIEKLEQLENGELDNSPSGKLLAKEMRNNPKFVKIYEDYKKDKINEYKIINHFFGHPTYWKLEGTTHIGVFNYNGEIPTHLNTPKCDYCKAKYPNTEKYEDRHDPCIKDLPGVNHACCGHGVSEPYVSFAEHASDGVTFRGDDAIEFFKKHGKGPVKK